TLVSVPIKKPPTIAASSVAALIRHQNQRRIKTRPGPVPTAIAHRMDSATDCSWGWRLAKVSQQTARLPDA
ncbi:MAG: hypothetical protein WBA01_09350, partial [Phormidesmis sp.]